MKFRTILKRVYLPTLLGVISLSVIFRIAAIFANYNFNTGFFEKKTLINIASVLVVAGSVFMFTYAFTGSKKFKLIADFSTPATYVPTGALSVAMMFFAVLTFIESSKTNFSIREFLMIPGVTPPILLNYISANMSSFVLSLMAPMACLAVGYFLLNACVLKRSSSLRAFFGTANVLFLAFYTSYLYFDTSSLARNAPNKIVDQMAFLFAALFFLYEIRISLGREKWNLYMAFGFIAATLTAYSSIPSLTVYFINGETISNNIQENVLSFALFIFIISRIALAVFLNEDKESESIPAIREYASARKSYIFAKEEAAKKAYMELYAELNEEESEDTLDEGEITEEDEEVLDEEDALEEDAENGEDTDGTQLSIDEAFVFDSNGENESEAQALDSTESSEHETTAERNEISEESILLTENTDENVDDNSTPEEDIADSQKAPEKQNEDVQERNI